MATVSLNLIWFELAESKQKPIKIENNFARELSKVNSDVLKYFKQRDFNSLYRDLDNAETIYIYSTGWATRVNRTIFWLMNCL